MKTYTQAYAKELAKEIAASISTTNQSTDQNQAFGLSNYSKGLSRDELANIGQLINMNSDLQRVLNTDPAYSDTSKSEDQASLIYKICTVTPAQEDTLSRGAKESLELAKQFVRRLEDQLEQEKAVERAIRVAKSVGSTQTHDLDHYNVIRLAMLDRVGQILEFPKSPAEYEARKEWEDQILAWADERFPREAKALRAYHQELINLDSTRKLAVGTAGAQPQHAQERLNRYNQKASEIGFPESLSGGHKSGM